MSFKYFSRNGEVLPIEQAMVPLSRVEYSYGFGVYESVRVAHDKIYFLDEHCQRLMTSAQTIGLDHALSAEVVKDHVLELLKQNEAEACNVKILLIGGPTAEAALLEIMCLNPLFPDRKLYKEGATCIIYEYEREFPAAKTLNMLSSYLAFRQAKAAGAYDALLINRQGCVTEGTRTNFFGLKDRAIISPPADQILPGVTRGKVLEVAKQNGFEVVERNINLKQLDDFDGVFLTSTSSKILPIKSIDERHFNLPPALTELVQAFNNFLNEYTP